jgi:CBS domain-containing protein
MKVINIVNNQYPTIEKDARIKDAINLMLKKNTDRLIVVNKGKLYGILTEYDLFFKLSQRKTKRFQPYNISVSGAASRPVDTIHPTTEVKTAAQMMIRRGYSSLPVVDKEKLYGLVTKWELIEILYKAGQNALETPLTQIMDKVRAKVELFHRLVQALTKMKAVGYNTLIVTDHKKYIGIISALDIARTLYMVKKINPVEHWDAVLRNILVAELVNRNIFTLTPENTILDAVNILRSKRQKLIPIVEEDEVTGIISRRHLLRYMIDMKII